jgi:hypothetical protein
MEFAKSFIINSFQERGISQTDGLISSVSKESVSELDTEIINLQAH